MALTEETRYAITGCDFCGSGSLTNSHLPEMITIPSQKGTPLAAVTTICPQVEPHRLLLPPAGSGQGAFGFLGLASV